MELTATGIVTDSHRIPFSPLVTLGYKICNTRFLKFEIPDFSNSQRPTSKLATPDFKTRNARLKNSQRSVLILITLGP